MSSPKPGMPTDLSEWDVGHQPNVGAVTILITACTDYLQALTGLCGAGVQLMRTFVSPSAIGSFLPAQENEAAQKMWGVWEEVNKLTQQAVWTVRTQTIQALKNWLIKQKAGEDHAKALKPSDLSKLLSSCLVAIMQLQCQFSLINYRTFSELIGSQINNLCPLTPDEINEQQAAHSPSSQMDHLTVQNHAESIPCDHHHIHYEDGGDDDDDVADEPPPSSYFLGRRSSYGGSLHTSSPPPLNSALGRRWSVPGGDAALEEGWTKEIQQRTGSKGMHYVAGFGRAIRGTGNSKRKGSLVSKEELDSVIDLLSCGQESHSDRGSSTPTSSTNLLNLLMPPSIPPDWSPPASLSQPPTPLQECSSQNAAGIWGWSSSTTTSQMQGTKDGGLLTFAASPTYKRKEQKKPDGWTSAHRAATYLDMLTAANNQRLHSISPQPPSMTASPNVPVSVSPNCSDETNEAEGAFAIGLNLSGSDLVAAAVQRKGNEKNNIPVVLTPPVEDKNSRNVSFAPDDSAGGHTLWTSTKHCNSQTPAGFLSFALEGPPGPTIWTPSPNDYSTPRGTYPYQVEP